MIRALLLILLFLPGLARAATPAAETHPPPAAAPPPASLTPAQAQQVLQVLQNPRERAHFIAVLQDMARALPAKPAAPPAKPKQPAPASPLPVKLAPNSLGAQVLLRISNGIATLSAEAATTARTVADFPLFAAWISGAVADPALRAQALDTAWRLVVVFSAALLAEFLCRMALRRPRRAVLQRAPVANGNGSGNILPPEPDTVAGDGADPPPSSLDRAEAGESEPPAQRRRRLRSAWTLLRRLPFAAVLLLLELIPVVAFAAVGNILLGTGLGAATTTRLVILAVVNAYVAARIVIVVMAAIVSPAASPLRLVRIGDAAAAYVMRWTRRIVVVIVVGGAIAEIGLLFGLYWGAYQAILKLTGLIFHAMLVIVVLQSHAAVAARIRARPGASGLGAVLRNWLAASWSWIAIFFIVAIWLVWAIELPHGFSRLLHFALVTAAVLIGGRVVGIVVLGVLDRYLRPGSEFAVRHPGWQGRAHRYHPILRRIVTVLVFALVLIVLLQAWGLGAFEWFAQGALGASVLSSLASLAVTLLLAAIVWEAVNASADRHINRLAQEGQPGRAARLRTLLPVLRTTLLVTILVILALMVLSDIGVNIAPLLAGASIVGVAIGFGSQKLVQDVITGMFLLLENAMQVGDWVTLAGMSGSVEKLSVRTIRLRASDGSVHIIPFSAVTTVTNTNRGLGNASVNVTVAAEEDTDTVFEALKEVAAGLRADPDFAPVILGDLALWGVDKVEGAGVTVAGQIQCTDSGRWRVQREFNRRMKKRFAELGIRLAVPVQALRVENGAKPDEPVPPRSEPASPTAPA